MDRLSLTALCGLLAASLAHGQEPPASTMRQQPAQPVFRAGTNLVRVDVSVMDRRGNPVTDLTAADFEVREDDLVQTVQSFQLVSATGEAPRASDESLVIRSREHAAAEAARDDVRVVLIFWDEYHVDRMPSANKAREFLVRFVTSAFGPTDLVGLMDPLTPTEAIEFTRDRAGLVRRIQRLEGRLGVYFPPRSAVEEAHLQYMQDAARLRAEVTLSALQAAAVYLGTIRESRKSIVFVSEGIGSLGSDWARWLREVSQAANTANTAIYTVDPRGLGTSAWRSDSLIELAINSGGEAFVNVNYPERLLKRAVTVQSAFYLLGYQSTQNPTDGKFHAIDVRVRRPGVTVRARRGYWVPAATDIERERTAAAAAEAPPEVADALSVLSSSQARRPVAVWVGTALAATGGTEVTMTWAPQPNVGQSGGQAVAFSLTVRTPDGRAIFDGATGSRRLAFTTLPGVLTLKAEFRDAVGGVIDSETRSLTVPDYAGARLAIGTPVVLRARSPAEFRELGTSPDPVPFAGREFARTDRLLLRFALYTSGGPVVEPSVRLLSRRGQVLTTLQSAPLAGTPGVYQLDLPLSFAAPGDYVVSITAQRGDERAEALVALRIVS